MLTLNTTIRALLVTLLFAGLGLALQSLYGGVRVHGGYFYGLLGSVWLIAVLIVAVPAPRNVVQRSDGALERQFLMDSLGAYSPVVYSSVDRDGRLTEISGSARAMAGIDVDGLIGVSVPELVAGDPLLVADVQRALAGEHFVTERQFGARHYRHHFFPIYSRSGEMLGYSCVSVDLTQEHSLNAELTLMRELLQNTTDAISVSDRHHRVIGVNQAFASITGFSHEEVVGRKAGLPLIEGANPGLYRDMLRALRQRGVWQGEVRARRKGGELYSANLTLSVIRENGVIAHYLAFFCDITDLSDIRRSQEELQYQVNHDHLTGLPNRRLFLDRLDQAMKRAKRLGGRLAVYFVDLDNFKLVNDAHGHQFGDEVLKSVGARLQMVMRDMDTVARLAGDEFTVIAENVADREQILSVARKIVDCFATPFAFDGGSLELSASVGIGVYPDDGEDMVALLGGADAAMYKAKALGRNGFFELSDRLGLDGVGKLVQLSDLRLAMHREQMALVYQPLLDLRTGGVVGCEALLRWNHGALGVVSPRDFLPLVEEKGVIPELGSWVVHEMSGRYNLWREQGVVLDFVSINVGRQQLEGEGFLDSARDAAEMNALPPGSLMLDIPEILALDDLERTRRFIAAAHARGFVCAINDFGASGKPFDYLRELPVAMIKLDQRMVGSPRPSGELQQLLNAIVTLANLLGIRVLGVGVEQSRQEALLRDLGCHYAQGYLYARPLGGAEFPVFFRAQQSPSPGIARSAGAAPLS